MNLINLFFHIFLTLLIITDPLGNTPTFLVLTKDFGEQERRRIITKASLVAAGILIFMAILGKYILNFFNLNLATLQIAGGLLLMAIAFEMVLGIPKIKIAEGKAEINSLAVAPMGTPLIAGPGAITAVLIFMSQSQEIGEKFIVVLGIVFTIFILWAILSNCGLVLKIIKKDGAAALKKIMGLILATIAVGMVSQGIKGVFLIYF